MMANVMERLVPISQFNKGQATKIFSRLKSERELFVLKNGRKRNETDCSYGNCHGRFGNQ